MKRKHWMWHQLPVLVFPPLVPKQAMSHIWVVLWTEWLVTAVPLTVLRGCPSLAVAARPHFACLAHSSWQNLESLSRLQSIMGVSTLHIRAGTQLFQVSHPFTLSFLNSSLSRNRPVFTGPSPLRVFVCFLACQKQGLPVIGSA